MLFETVAKEGRIIVCLSSSTETLDVFAHEDAVYGLSVSPVNDNIFASSSDDGRVLIWDIRESSHGGKISRWKDHYFRKNLGYGQARECKSYVYLDNQNGECWRRVKMMDNSYGL